MGRAIVGVEDRIRQPITILRDKVDTRIQDMGIERERGNTHEGTMAGLRVATDAEMGRR